ncbi:MAG: PAS domain S-box protein [Flavobacteriales bacterium]|nr:PAS domain S-box protein [Flavobacteriales bacterium]
MGVSIFKSGDKSSFGKQSRRMAQLLAIGAASLSITHCLFIFFYFSSNAIVKGISLVFPLAYFTALILVSFTKISNKKFYEIIVVIFIATSLGLLYISYQFSFNSEYVIIMLMIYTIMLVSIPTPKQVLAYFGIIFTSLLITLLFSEISLGFSLLVIASFGYVFVLCYVVSKQKKNLNYKSHQNSEILKALIGNTNDSIFLIDFFSKEIWDANEKTKELFGLNNLKEVLNKKYYELFSDEDYMPSNRSEITQQISEYGYYQAEALFKKKNGEEFWGSILLSPFQAVKNNYYLIQIKNIDSKKKYDDRLIANNEKLKFILNSLEEFIYLASYVNGEEKFEYMSPYIEQLFGVTKTEYTSGEIRNKLDHIYHPDDLYKIKELKEEVFKTKNKVDTVYRIKPIGKENYISINETVIPNLNETGEIDQLLGILKEVKN